MRGAAYGARQVTAYLSCQSAGCRDSSGVTREMNRSVLSAAWDTGYFQKRLTAWAVACAVRPRGACWAELKRCAARRGGVASRISATCHNGGTDTHWVLLRWRAECVWIQPNPDSEAVPWTLVSVCCIVLGALSLAVGGLGFHQAGSVKDATAVRWVRFVSAFAIVVLISCDGDSWPDWCAY